MRRLMLLRHAKSDRSPGVRDIDRPLNARGLRTAPRMGEYLAAEGLAPDAVAVSPSQRTRSTWEAISPSLASVRPTYVDAIYEAPARALLDVIRSTPGETTSLLLVGHNPGIQEVALDLVGAGSREARAQLALEFPTAALAVIDFEEDWSDLRSRSGRLERFVTPKGLDRDAS